MSERVLAGLRDELVELAASVLPATVTIVTGSGTGSGWFFDGEGHIVTNHHVVGVGQFLELRLPGGAVSSAELVGADPLTDLAVLKATESPMRHLNLRRSPAMLGEPCLAVGSPLGKYPESVSFGIVSGLLRSITSPGGRPIEAVIQTDTAINPGNSGGPLVDIDSEVIGVNTAIATHSEGIGFAVPAETVSGVTQELVVHGEVARASLGVSVAERDADGRMQVTQVKQEGSRLRSGDIFCEVDGLSIDSRHDLFRVLDRSRVDTDVIIAVERQGARCDVTVRTFRLRPSI